MTLQKRIFSQLSEQKNKTTKLSMIDDIQAIVNNARSTRENWDNTLTDLYNELFSLSSKFNDVKDLYNSYMSDVDTIKEDYESFKEDLNLLGIEINAVTYTNEIEAFLNTSQDVYAEMIEAVAVFENLNK
jgi:archaellum component FlaC